MQFKPQVLKMERLQSTTLDDAFCFGDDICFYCEDSEGYLFNHHSGSLHNSLHVFKGQEDKNDQTDAPHHPEDVLHHPKGVLHPYTIQFKIVPKQSYKETKKDADTPAAQLEADRNRYERNRQKGRKLRYGDTFQLQHKFTGKYIHVSTTETSRQDKNNMMVFLAAENGKRAQFKIFPKFKVKAEGDMVQIGDRVVLESVKTPGQYLHVSNPYAVSQLITGCELNLGVLGTSFTAMRARPALSTNNISLRAGSLIRLLHKETNSYLVTSGIVNRDPSEDVHMRMRKREAQPSSSAITYWIVEAGSGIVYGDIIDWKQHIRLRHMTTMRYLILQPNGKLALTPDGADPLTVFKLHPVIETRKAILVETYTWIQHVITEKWIHADTALYIRKELSGNQKYKKSIRWDTATLKEVTCVNERNYDDAFTIQQVDTKLVASFLFAIGMVPSIQELVLCCEQGIKLTIRQLKAAVKGLEELAEWMEDKGSISTQKQTLLRDLGIVDLLVESLMHNKETLGQTHETFQRFQVNAYKVLETFLKGNSRKNELYVWKYIEFFTSMFAVESVVGMRATEMMIELIKDNRMVIDRLTQPEITSFIDLVKNRQNYRFVALLGHLCVCDGVALPENQNFIAQHLLKADTKGMWLTEIGSRIYRDPSKVYVCKEHGKEWAPIHEYCTEVKEDGTCTDQDYLFLRNQLDLFAKLCEGRNQKCIDLITQELSYLTCEEAFMCLRDEDLPDELRAKYCHLITGLFVDVGDNRSILDQLNLTFIYENIGHKEMLENVSDQMQVANKPSLTQIRDWLNKFFHSNKHMTASLLGRNQLIEQVLGLVHNLITYGYYSSMVDIHALLGPLLSLLDGRNDIPVPKDEEGTVVDINAYKERERFQKSQETKAIVEAKYKAMEVLDLIMDIECKIRLERFLASYKKRDTSEKRLTKMMTDTALFKEKDTDILLDLTNYDYKKMVVKAMTLMNKFYSAHECLFKNALQAQVLITEDSVKVHGEVLVNLPLLRRLLSVKVQQNEVQQVCAILDKFTSYCHLPGEPDEPHPINQNILVNNDVLEIIFDLLQQKLDSDLLTQNSDFQMVLRSTLVLLKFLMKGNKYVQTKAFENFDFLIEIREVEKELGEAMIEIFMGNKETCLHVKAEQIKRVMQRTAYLRQKAPEFLDLLCAIVKIDELDQPLKRNQGHVMRALIKNYHDVAYVMEEPQAYRQGILRHGSPQAKELSYLISLIDLLASCAEGVNAYIESQCQSILKADEVIETLNDDGIDNNLKRPYMRFLLWAYVKAGVSPTESETTELSTKILPWKRAFLGQLAQCTEWLKKHGEEAKRLLKKSPPKSYVSEEDAMFTTLHFIFDAALPFLKEEYNSEKFDHTLSKEENNMVEDLVPELMHFADTVTPLISSHAQLESLNGAVWAVLDQANQDVQRDEKQAYLLRCQKAAGGILQVVLSDARIAPGVDSEVIFHEGQLSQIQPQNPQHYNNLYESEETLNHQLNGFVQHMRNQYRKPNTLKDQLHLHQKIQYCEQSQAKWLPLGREFQKMVKRFTNNGTGRKYEHIKKIIHQLYISCTMLKPKDQNRPEQVALDIKCLQVMRALIHNQERQIPESVNPNGNNRFKDEIKKIQAELNEYKAIVKMMPLMSRPQKGITGQYLSFMTAMFYDANMDSQKSITDYFQGARDERFFQTCKDLLQGSITATKELRSLSDKEGSKREQSSKTLEKLLAKFNINDYSTNGHIATLSKMSKREVRKMKREEYMVYVNGAIHRDKHPRSKVVTTLEDKSLHKMPTTAKANVKDDEFNIHLLLEMLASMCDGQYKPLQDYLRHQKDNIESVNVVGEVVKYFSHHYARIDQNNIVLVTQLLTTLNEFCSGNSDNAQTVFDHELGDYLNHLLRQDFTSLKSEKMLKLHEITANLIMSVIEEDHPSTAKLTLEVRRMFDVISIRKIATYYYKQVHASQGDAKRPGSKSLPPVAKEQMICVGFKYHFLMKRMLDIQPEEQDEEENGFVQNTADHHTAMKYFENNSMSVEVITPKGLQCIRFRVENQKVLREETKEKVKWSIQRGSASDKLRDLLDWSKDILEDIEYQKWIRKWKWANFVLSHWLAWNYIVIGLSIVFNVFMLVTWDTQGALGKTDLTNLTAIPDSIHSPIPVTPPWYNFVLLPVGILHNIFSLIVVLVYFVSNNLAPQTCSLPHIYRCRKDDTKEESVEKQRPSHLRPKLLSFATIYYIAFMVFSICGTIFYGYFFAFHLLNIVFNNNLLQRVIRAVTQNGKALMWVAVLGLFVLYIFTLFAFALMRQSIDPNGEQTLFCTTLWQCLVTVIRFGLLGELFEYMRPHELTLNFVTFGWAAIFHISFFIIISTIGLNIVFGIILDTFSELREAKREAEKDMNLVCFICNRNSFEFDNQAQGFKYHVKNEHNMWAYVFLRIVLNSIDEKDFTTIESYVYQQMVEQKISFFPIGQARSLSNVEDDGLHTQLTDILHKLDSIIAKQAAQDAERKQNEEAAWQEDWKRQHLESYQEDDDSQPQEEGNTDDGQVQTAVPFRSQLLVNDGDEDDKDEEEDEDDEEDKDETVEEEEGNDDDLDNVM